MEIRNLREVDKHVNNETILNQEHLNVTLLKYINKIKVPVVCLQQSYDMIVKVGNTVEANIDTPN